MLSIEGNDLETVLKTVASDERFSAEERADAQGIADNLDDDDAVIRRDITGGDWYTLRLAESGHGTEFSIHPYTTGNTMNVGICE